MGLIVKRNQPCRNPSCGSSDAMQIYEDKSAHCFSCGANFKRVSDDDFEMYDKSKKSEEAAVSSGSEIDEIVELPIRGFQERNITKAVSEFYNVKVDYSDDGKIAHHYYPYGAGDKVGFNVRTVKSKDFRRIGVLHQMFGQSAFQGGGKRVIITEGELDAMSFAQASLDRYSRIYPAVALPGSNNHKMLIEHRDWLRSFGEIILAFDNDTPGNELKDKAIKILGIDKVKLWQPPPGCKDASDILVKHGYEKLLQVIYDSQRYVPNGIMTKDALWNRMEEHSKIVAHPYPKCLRGLNSKLKGKRVGDIVLLISGTGAGKSSIVREIILDIIETTDDMVGVVALEESPEETGTKLSAMAIERNPSIETNPIALGELKVGFDKVFGDDRVILLDHIGGFKDVSILDKLEYMALSGCKYILLDHITLLVSEGADGLTGNEAIDSMMNKLLSLVKAHDICLILVSHLRKTNNMQKSFEEGKMPSMDDIKGSGSIKQISMDIIAFCRNMIAEDEVERNTIRMRVLKCRCTGLTGDVEGTFYEHKSGRLRNLEAKPVEEFTAL